MYVPDYLGTTGVVGRTGSRTCYDRGTALTVLFFAKIFVTDGAAPQPLLELPIVSFYYIKSVVQY